MMYAVIYYDPCKCGYELIGAYSNKSTAEESLRILRNDIAEGKSEASAPGIVVIDEKLTIKDKVMSNKNKEPNYQRVYKFNNGYGASVVCNTMSYGHSDGLFEVAVLKGEKLCYDTDICNDVVGYCDFAEVAELLERIKNLPKVES